jgi:uncharacterized protein
VVQRCPFGQPAVTEQEPYASDGSPFPTTYYLTCPYAVAAVSRLEAAGGVERWSALASADPELRKSVETATREQRELRHALAGERIGSDGGASLELGIGGSASALRLKCLHAHVAFALARPGYVLGDRIVAELEQMFPEDGCCSL